LVDEYQWFSRLIVLNIGFSLGVISPLLLRCWLDYGAGNDIYDLAPGWTYPKRLIKLDMVESSEEELV